MADISSNPSSTVPSPDDWLARRAERQFHEAEILQANKAALLRALARAGISIVVVIFDGCGDSAQIKSVEVRIGNTRVTFPGHQVDILQLDWDQTDPRCHKMSLTAAVRTIFWDILAATNCGCANDDGALSEFTIDVAGHRITLDHGEQRQDFYTQAFGGGDHG